MLTADEAELRFVPNTSMLGPASFSAMSIQLTLQPYDVILPLYLSEENVGILSVYKSSGTFTPAGSHSDDELDTATLMFEISEGKESQHSWTQIVFNFTTAGKPRVATLKLTAYQGRLHGQKGTCTFSKRQLLA